MKNKKSIAFFEVEEWEKKYLKNKLKNFKIYFFNDILEKKDIKKIKDINILSPFVYSKIDKDIIRKLPFLKLITTRSTGFDHLDLKEIRKNKIKATNVPFYGENTVAEHTFALILSLTRKIHKTYERTSRGNFDLEGLRGFDLKNKTIGIIGAGHIGQHVIRIAKGFEMNILVFDSIKDIKLSKKLGFKYTTFNNLLKNSDIISLHVPYNKKTHHLINRKNIKLIKNRSIIINTSRGGLIDTTALLDGLRNNKLWGIGLDVLEEEKFIIKEEKQLLSPHVCGLNHKNKKECLQSIVEGHTLLSSNKVIITPHNAFNSQEALERILDTTINNILDFENKNKLKNLIK